MVLAKCVHLKLAPAKKPLVLSVHESPVSSANDFARLLLLGELE
jgi:hypothetical protein